MNRNTRRIKKKTEAKRIAIEELETLQTRML